MSDDRRKKVADQLPPHTVLGYIQPSGSRNYDQQTVWVENRPSRAALIKIAEALTKHFDVDRIEFIDHPAFAVLMDPPLGIWTPRDSSQVKEKDWSKQPSNTEVEIWEDRMQDQTDLAGIDETASIKAVAKKRGINEREVRAAVNKVRSWIAN